MSKQHRAEPTDSVLSHPLVENNQAGDLSDQTDRPLLETTITGFALGQAIRDQAGNESMNSYG